MAINRKFIFFGYNLKVLAKLVSIKIKSKNGNWNEYDNEMGESCKEN